MKPLLGCLTVAAVFLAIAKGRIVIDVDEYAQLWVVRSANNLKYDASYALKSHAHYKGTNRLTYAAIPNAFQYPATLKRHPKSEQVSLVTQLSLDRLDRLPYLILAWPGPISIALYVHRPSDWIEHLLQDLFHKIDRYRQHRKHAVQFHLVFSHRFHDPSDPPYDRPVSYDDLYPVNLLRNAAVLFATGAHVLYTDVDFVPTAGLYHQLTQFITTHKNWFTPNPQKSDSNQQPRNRRVLVIPALELAPPQMADWATYLYDATEEMDSLYSTGSSGITPSILIQWCNQGRLIPFHSKRIEHYPLNLEKVRGWCRGDESQWESMEQQRGEINPNTTTYYHVKLTGVQGATQFRTYFQSLHQRSAQSNNKPDQREDPHEDTDDIYELTDLNTLIHTTHLYDRFYEPYFLLPKANFPKFDTRFRGYSFNKRQHSILLQTMGLEFYALKGRPASASLNTLTRNIGNPGDSGLGGFGGALVHLDHDVSESRKLWKQEDGEVVVRVFLGFLGELNAKMNAANAPLLAQLDTSQSSILGTVTGTSAQSAMNVVMPPDLGQNQDASSDSESTDIKTIEPISPVQVLVFLNWNGTDANWNAGDVVERMLRMDPVRLTPMDEFLSAYGFGFDDLL